MPNDPEVVRRYVLDEPGGNVLLDLFILDQRLGALLKAAFVDVGVAPAHYALLAQVHRGVATPKELAERLSLSPGTLTGYLDALERAAYLRRSRSTRDGRSVTITLTRAGEAKRAACQAVMASLVRRLDRSLGGAPRRNEVRSALGELGVAFDALEVALGK